MTQTSMVWSGITTGDATIAPYSSDEYSDYVRDINQADRLRMGVISTNLTGYSGYLAVTNPAGTTIRVATGMALVDGTLYRNDASVDNAVVAPGAGSNFYRIVLRKSWAAQTVRVAVLGPNAVAPPAVTQTDGTTWEISLATVEITSASVITVTDARTFFGSIAAVNNLYSGTILHEGAFIAGGSSIGDIGLPDAARNSVTIGGDTNVPPQGDNAVIIGGNTNSIGNAAADDSAVIAGEDNGVSSVRSIVLGGGSNSISSGGAENAILGGGGATGSGDGNTIEGTANVIVGGKQNSITETGTTSSSNFIGCGVSGRIDDGDYSAILGGLNNDIDQASDAAIVGGSNNDIDAGGDGSVVLGGGLATVSATNSVALGVCAGGLLDNAIAHGAGYYSASSERGTCQSIHINVGAEVTHSDANWHRLYIDINAGTGELSVPSDSIWTFNILVAGKTSNGAAKVFAYIIDGAIGNIGGTTALVAASTVTVIGESDVSFDVQAIADDANDSLAIEAQDTDSAGDTVRWGANVRIMQVIYP